VLGTAIAALAVDRHAAREHQAAVEARVVQGPEQDRRAEVVVADVGGDVADVDPHPDHRRLMRDGVDARHGRRRRRGIA
jgi:hypothetical protein